jgi:hypothetical protein
MITARRDGDTAGVSTMEPVATPASATPAPARSSTWLRVGAAVLLLTAVLSLILTAFALPATRSTLRDVPLAVAGPVSAGDRVVATLRQQRPGAFAIVRVADTADAEGAIRDRTVYGAIDLSGTRPQVITASAASPAIAQALSQLAQTLGTGAVVRDIVPAPPTDPRGAGLAASALPLVIGGILAAALLTNLIAGAVRRVVGAIAFAAASGLAMAGILHGLGSLEGPYWVNAAAIGLGTAAVALTVVGLESLLGTPGLALGATTMMLLGNPLSGLSSAPEMLPTGWGTLGQLLPPGAEGSLLRDTAFFNGHAAAGHIVVLLCWIVAGLLVSLAGATRSRRRARIR